MLHKEQILKFLNLFKAALGLCCCTQAFSSCEEGGYSLVAVHTSIVVDHGLQGKGSVIAAPG